MKIVIAGGSGFLGGALAQRLAADGRDVVVLTRQGSRAARRSIRFAGWNPDENGPWAGEIDGADAVVNLAGESIAAKRWSTAQRRRILDSRVQATKALAGAIRAARRPPAAFISGSAVGYYGPRDDEFVTEAQSAGQDFLAHVCERWESEALQGAGRVTRVACIRTGLALEKNGGAFPRILLPFKFGAGGRLGSGRQYWPWIHLDDWVELVRWAIDTPSVAGPLNATAPSPVTNAEFTRALGRVLHRPAFMPAPAFALRIALGEMADALLLSGQRAVPAAAERLGFTFRHKNLEDALRAILN